MTSKNLEEAIKLFIPDSNTIHSIVNGASDEMVPLPEGGEAPTVRKAFADSLLFKNPTLWDSGSTETDPLQLRTFTDGLIYWAPTAQLTNPIAMGLSPIGDSNWKIAPLAVNNEGLIRVFDTVADMKAATWLQAGQFVETKGYHVAGDGGQVRYLIKTSAEFGSTPDEYGNLTLDNGNVAVLCDGEYNVTMFGIFPSNTPEDNYERLVKVYDTFTPSVLKFTLQGEYRFSQPISPPSYWKHVGIHREKTWISVTANSNGVLLTQGQEGVEFYSLGFTQNFDRKDHLILTGGNTTGDQRSFFASHTWCASKVVIRDCYFKNIARQAIWALGPATEWNIQGNIFEDVSREAALFHAGSNGGGSGHLITNNLCIRCGDDVFNFRNHHSSTFSYNYVKAENEPLNVAGQPGAASSGLTADASVKLHGNGNTVIGNVFESSGNRAVEIRASNPSGGTGGAPTGNIVQGNSFLYTGTIGSNTAALKLATSEGGYNLVTGNFFRWTKLTPAIRITPPVEGFPVNPVEPHKAVSCMISDNVFDTALLPLSISGSAVAGDIRLVNNVFKNMEQGKLLKFEGTGAEILDICLKNNRFDYVDGVELEEPIDLGSSSNRLYALSIVNNETNAVLTTPLISDGGQTQRNAITKFEVIDNDFYVRDSDTRVSRIPNCKLKNTGESPCSRVFVGSEGGIASLALSNLLTVITITPLINSTTSSELSLIVAAGFGNVNSKVIHAGNRVEVFENDDFSSTTVPLGSVGVAINERELRFLNNTNSGATFKVVIS